VLIFGRTCAQGKNLAQCGLYGLVTGDLPLAFVCEQTAAVALVVGHPPRLRERHDDVFDRVQFELAGQG
jgi:hypothetical protein